MFGLGTSTVIQNSNEKLNCHNEGVYQHHGQFQTECLCLFSGFKNRKKAIIRNLQSTKLKINKLIHSLFSNLCLCDAFVFIFKWCEKAGQQFPSVYFKLTSLFSTIAVAVHEFYQKVWSGGLFLSASSSSQRRSLFWAAAILLLAEPLPSFQLSTVTFCMPQLHCSSHSLGSLICDAAAEHLWVTWSQTLQVLALLCQE